MCVSPNPPVHLTSSPLPLLVSIPGWIPGLWRSPGEGNGYPLQYFAWRIPWTEEPGRLYGPWRHKGPDVTELLTLLPSFHQGPIEIILPWRPSQILKSEFICPPSFKFQGPGTQELDLSHFFVQAQGSMPSTESRTAKVSGTTELNQEPA